MKPTLNIKWYYALVISISTALFIYVGYRAFHLSMTFDEVWTYDLAKQSIVDICTAERNFTSANNHILNSILIKPCLAIFGHEVWVLRLPNVISFLFYLLGSLLIVNKLTKSNTLRLLGFLCFILQLYVLDFFSLSRGYGLAMAFQQMSLALILSYLINRKHKYLFYSFALAALAVAANFTWLNYFVCLWAVVNIHFLFLNRQQLQPYFQSFFKRNALIAAIALVLGAFSFIPIRFLRQQDEFKWGANGWFDSFHTFAKDFNYSNNFTAAIVMQVVLMLIVSIALFVIWQNRSNIYKNSLHNLFFVMCLLGMIILATIVQRHLLNTMYMDGRKAIMYVPLLVSLIVLLLNYYATNHSKVVAIKGPMLGVFVIIHFFICSNLHAVREWWFDQDTKSVIEIMHTKSGTSKGSVSMHWLFESSFSYYNRTNYHLQFEPIVKLHEDPYTDSTDYYYIFKDALNLMPPNYQIEKEFDFGGVLLSKKGN